MAIIFDPDSLLPEKSSKLFTTLYRLDLVLNGGTMYIRINQYNPYEKKLYIKAKHLIDYDSLDKFGKYVKKDLINKGNCWIRDTNMDTFCTSFGWNKIKHFEGCAKCDGFRFIPLLNYYTGCTICNENDQKTYTYFEAEERSRKFQG